MLGLQPSLALSQDASGRYRSERVHYMPLCEEEVPIEAASEQPAAAAKEPPAAEVKEEVKAEPAGAAEPKQEGDAQPAGADLVPSFIAVGGGTPSATTAGGDTEMTEAAAEAEDGADGAAAADAPAADAPVATPEKQALAAEVEALDVPGLVGRGKLASLTIAQLSKYCQVRRGGEMEGEGEGSRLSRLVPPLERCGHSAACPSAFPAPRCQSARRLATLPSMACSCTAWRLAARRPTLSRGSPSTCRCSELSRRPLGSSQQERRMYLLSLPGGSPSSQLCLPYLPFCRSAQLGMFVVTSCC